MAYRSSSWSGFGSSFQPTPMVKNLIIANTGVFVLLWIIPALRPWLWFAPVAVATTPWTVVTYMFVHASLGHLFFNMLGLFFFGPPLEAKWGGREFLKFYMIAGLGGAALSLLAPQTAIVGASAAVLGVLLAFAMNWPDAPIYVFGIFPVKAKWLAAFVALGALMSATSPTNDGIAHLAHLGGLIAALVYLKLDLQRRVSLRVLKRRPGRGRIRVVEKRAGRAAAKGSTPGREGREEAAMLDEVDKVLDKIGRDGMASLSDSERALLDEVSRRYRTN
ncbi:MAG: rhomboid family intramembrane serine protease [Gemmatimonadota bacterium]